MRSHPTRRRGDPRPAATRDPAHLRSPPGGPPLRAALGTVVAASAAPYGYALSIWSSGAVLMGAREIPRIGEVFAFLAGAVIGFGFVSVLARGSLARMETLDHPPDRVLAGTLNLCATGAAVGAVALIAELDSAAARPLGSFAATTIYLLGASAQLALVSGRRRRSAARALASP